MNGQNNNYEHEKSADELKEYIKEFSAGNKDAFDEIVRYQLPQLKNLAKIILNSPHDAEDVVQEALIKAYRSLDRFRGDAKITTWLCRIVINQAKNSLNSNYKRKTENEHCFPIDLASACEPPTLKRYIETELKPLLDLV